MTKKQFLEAIQKNLFPERQDDEPSENGGTILAKHVADALKPKDRERLLKEMGVEW